MRRSILYSGYFSLRSGRNESISGKVDPGFPLREALPHGSEKCAAVLGIRSRVDKWVELHDDSKNSHPALEAELPYLFGSEQERAVAGQKVELAMMDAAWRALEFSSIHNLARPCAGSLR